MKGRPPKNTAQHKRDGTYNATKHRDRKSFPKLDALPEAPDYFTDFQRERWDKVATMLHADDMLSDRFLSALEALCNVWQRWWEAKQNVDATGLTFTTDTGQTKQNPAVAIEKECLSLWLRFLQEFGYTPRASMAIKEVGKGTKENEDPFAALFGEN